jgi:hypothetical protein
MCLLGISCTRLSLSFSASSRRVCSPVMQSANKATDRKLRKDKRDMQTNVDTFLSVTFVAPKTKARRTEVFRYESTLEFPRSSASKLIKFNYYV